MTTPSPKTPMTAVRSGPLTGEARVPGDKSISHRALMLGALALGETSVHGLLESADVLATATAMRGFGARVERDRAGLWHVHGLGPGGLLEPEAALDFGNAGTGARLAMGLAAAHPFATTLIGDASLSRRPMGRVLEPLRAMGAEVVARSGDRLPLTLRGAEAMAPIRYVVPVPSAQVKSAVLLAGLSVEGVTSVVERVPTRDHTERMLAGFGADIETERGPDGGTIIHVRGLSGLKGQHVTVPGDPSSAAFLLAASVIVAGSDVTVRDVLLNPARTGFLTTLVEMGADLEIMNERASGGERIGDVRARASAIKGVVVPSGRAPSMIDEYPVLAVVAAFAEGDTRMEGLAELRVKESDRLSATAAALGVNGVSTETGEDWLLVRGRGAEGVPGGGTVETHLDHRLAMSPLVMGLASRRPVSVDDAGMIATSFPSFLDCLSGLGASFEARAEAA